MKMIVRIITSVRIRALGPFVGAFLLLASASSLVHGEIPSGFTEVRGTVVDSNHAAIAGASVKIVSATGVSSLVTNGSGQFSVNLKPGDYTLELENGSVTRPLTLKVTIRAGVPMTISRAMPGFDAERVVKDLLGSKE